MIKFSVITNTIRRSRELVEKSLLSSLGQDLVTEVILVDQNAEKMEFSEKVKNSEKFKHQLIQVPAVSMARNKALYSPDTDWLIFCDDDGYLDSYYLLKLFELIQAEPKTEIFAGSIRRIDTGKFYSKRHEVGGDMNRFWNTKLLMGSNFAIQKSTFEKLGKFDENFGAGAKYGSSEETDLAWNAYFHKINVKFAPELIVYHVPPFEGAWIPEIKKAFRYGAGKSALIRKWLWKGHPTVIIELAEMFLIPMVRSLQFLLKFQFKELVIQGSSIAGRFVGLFRIS